MASNSPHTVSVTIGAGDRSKVTLQWGVTEDQARAMARELTRRFGRPDHEFAAAAEAIDRATEAAFTHGGGILQHDA